MPDRVYPVGSGILGTGTSLPEWDPEPAPISEPAPPPQVVGFSPSVTFETIAKTLFDSEHGATGNDWWTQSGLQRFMQGGTDTGPQWVRTSTANLNSQGNLTAGIRVGHNNTSGGWVDSETRGSVVLSWLNLGPADAAKYSGAFKISGTVRVDLLWSGTGEPEATVVANGVAWPWELWLVDYGTSDLSGLSADGSDISDLYLSTFGSPRLIAQGVYTGLVRSASQPLVTGVPVEVSLPPPPTARIQLQLRIGSSLSAVPAAFALPVSVSMVPLYPDATGAATNIVAADYSISWLFPQLLWATPPIDTWTDPSTGQQWQRFGEGELGVSGTYGTMSAASGKSIAASVTTGTTTSDWDIVTRVRFTQTSSGCWLNIVNAASGSVYPHPSDGEFRDWGNDPYSVGGINWGQPAYVRLKVSNDGGATRYRGKAWQAGASEPTAWLYDKTTSSLHTFSDVEFELFGGASGASVEISQITLYAHFRG